MSLTVDWHGLQEQTPCHGIHIMGLAYCNFLMRDKNSLRLTLLPDCFIHSPDLL